MAFPSSLRPFLQVLGQDSPLLTQGDAGHLCPIQEPLRSFSLPSRHFLLPV